MRIFVNSGTGAGQYGIIGNYNSSTKVAQVLRESFDNVPITGASGTPTNTFNVSDKITTLYINQAIQFIPSYYTISITGSNLGQQQVTASVGGSINTLTVSNAYAFYTNMPVNFTGTIFTSVIAGYTYYVKDIIDATTITLSSTISGTLLSINAGTGSFTINYPTNTYYLTGAAGITSNMSIHLPITFTGNALGSLSVGTGYYIQDVIDTSTFTIASSLITFTPTSCTTTEFGTALNSNLVPLNPIVFTGATFGGITANTKYYIGSVTNTGTTAFTIVASPILVTINRTASGSDFITINEAVVNSFVIGNPIVFFGTTFGGILIEHTYYILAQIDANNFTICDNAPNSTVVHLSSVFPARGVFYAKTAGTPVTLSATGSGSMTATTTPRKLAITQGSGTMSGTYSTTLFGGITAGTTYYVNTITIGLGAAGTISVSTSQGAGFTGSGSPVTLTTGSGAMNIAAVGFDHINPGTPIQATLDSTSLYFIEPRITYSDPAFVQTSAATVYGLTSGVSWTMMANGNGYFVAIPSSGGTAARSTDGSVWSSISLPTTATWSSIAYGAGYFVIISYGNNVALYSASAGAGWRSTTLPATANWTSVIYGNGRFVAVCQGATTTAYSTDFGQTWINGGTLSISNAYYMAYGNGRFVALSGLSVRASTSQDGITWTNSNLFPVNGSFTGISFGNGRFVIVQDDYTAAAAAQTIYSFDGITWYSSLNRISAATITYGQGVFLAFGQSGAFTSESGLEWKTQSVASSTYTAIAFGFTPTNQGVFSTLGGQNLGYTISAGIRTKGRANISSNAITSIAEWEPGAGYTTSPTLAITDPNVTALATYTLRTGNGTLGQPTFVSRGNNYNNTSTVITITGNGYSDAFQTGFTIILNNLTRLPLVGDNLTITGISQVYKVTSATVMYGTTAPSFQANVQISPAMTTVLSPVNGTTVQVRTKYSQVRLTGHDFLYIGSGNFSTTNYPSGVSIATSAPQNQTVELNYGRVFYTSTDQDGNFKVGTLFGVQQATGIVTLSASQFGLSGLSTLSLGGVALGGSGVVIQGFSTDGTFTANTDSVIPTQKAIKTYLTSRLTQGGSNTSTGQLTAGTILVGGAQFIASTIPAGTTGSNVKMVSKVYIAGSSGASTVDGNMAALDFFMRSATRRS
jgi:hypothetical protein